MSIVADAKLQESYAWLQKILRYSWLTLAGLVLAHVLMYRHAGTAQVMFGPATALALGSLVVARPSWGRPLVTRAMVYFGKRSYAVYLVNLICLSVCVEVAHHVAPSVAFNSDNQPARHGAWAASLVLLLAVTATSLLLSELLYRTIERPMIARGRIWSKRITGRRPVAPPRLTPEVEDEEAREQPEREPEVVVTPPASLKQPAPS